MCLVPLNVHENRRVSFEDTILEQIFFFLSMKHVQVTLENKYFNTDSIFINMGTDIVFEDDTE